MVGQNEESIVSNAATLPELKPARLEVEEFVGRPRLWPAYCRSMQGWRHEKAI